jgi:hypothetical protein
MAGTCSTHGELQNAHKISVGKLQGKRQPREDNTGMNLPERACGYGKDSTDPGYRVQLQAFVNTYEYLGSINARTS